MGKRLEMTLFGTYHRVGAVYLFRKSIRAGVGAYGKKGWHVIVRDIALGLASTKVIQEAGNVVGQPLKPLYQVQGIGMQGGGFGMEVFHGGTFVPISMIEAENRTLQAGGLMRQCCTGDMLGVFRAEKQGALFFRWDDVDELVPEDVVLSYDNVAGLLGRKRSFDIAVGVTWKGTKGRRKELDTDGEFQAHRHVFHMSK